METGSCPAGTVYKRLPGLCGVWEEIWVIWSIYCTSALLTLWLWAFLCLNHISASNMFTHVAVYTHFVFVWGFFVSGQWIAWMRLLCEGQRWEQGNLRLEMSNVLFNLRGLSLPGATSFYMSTCPLCCCFPMLCLSLGTLKKNREPEKDMMGIKWLWLTVIWKWNIKFGLWRGGKLSL